MLMRKRIIVAAITTAITASAFGFAPQAAAAPGWHYQDGEWTWVYETKEAAAADQAVWLDWCTMHDCKVKMEPTGEPYYVESEKVVERDKPNCTNSNAEYWFTTSKAVGDALIESLSEEFKKSVTNEESWQLNGEFGGDFSLSKLFSVRSSHKASGHESETTTDAWAHQTGRSFSNATSHTEGARRIETVLPGQIGVISYTPKLQDYTVHIYGPEAYESAADPNADASSEPVGDGRIYYREERDMKSFPYDLGGEGFNKREVTIPQPAAESIPGWSLRATDIPVNDIPELCELRDYAPGLVTDENGRITLSDNVKPWKYFRVKYMGESGCSAETRVEVGSLRDSGSILWKSPAEASGALNPGQTSNVVQFTDGYTAPGQSGQHIRVSCGGTPRSDVAVDIYASQWVDNDEDE
ncbi:hypothetical protein ACIQMR_36790 [Streptomyces sp. NPDC091376]|uniref:hypothetical protein n=1 Tax=Streptomyces sp. NPDC091376 TaxID=3365994 RepID=UPI00380C934C